MDWDEVLPSTFVKIESGVPVKLLLTNWRPQDKFKDNDGELRPGVIFDVLEEDDDSFTPPDVKTWTVTSFRALSKLRPICEKATAEGRDRVKVSVLRVGDGKQTTFDIKEI